MENRSYALMTGFFTIALVLAAVLAGLWFNRDTATRVPYEIATTQSIPGLNPQAGVRYRGLVVGKVESIDFNPRKTGEILISLALDPQTPVTTTTYARLGYQGVTGIAYVQLDDDTTGSPLLARRAGQVPMIPLQPGLLDQLEKRGTAILDLAEQVTRRANDLLSPGNQRALRGAIDKFDLAADRFAQLPDRLEPTLNRLPELTQKIDGAMTDVSQLAQDWDKLGLRLNAAGGPLDQLDTTMHTVSGVARTVEQQSLPAVVELSGEAKSSLRAVRRAVDHLDARPQSILFGNQAVAPGPGEPGFTPPAK